MKEKTNKTNKLLEMNLPSHSSPNVSGLQNSPRMLSIWNKKGKKKTPTILIDAGILTTVDEKNMQ